MAIEQYAFELSIITITFNAEKELAKTIASICEQKIDKQFKIQYIIQDGMSSDKTLAIAEKYCNILKNKGITFSVFSEKDTGIYDAMNKGRQKATGKWIQLLNAGDVFHDSKSLCVLYNCIKGNNADIVYSNYCRINPCGVRFVKILELDRLKEEMIFCHQATAVKKELYTKIIYDVKYHLAADYDFFLKCYKAGVKFCHLKYYLIDYDLSGQSANNMISTYKEIYKVKQEQNFNERNMITKLRYIIGIVKRKVLSVLPQWIRWPITNFIHNIKDKQL